MSNGVGRLIALGSMASGIVFLFARPFDAILFALGLALILGGIGMLLALMPVREDDEPRRRRGF